jgi:hypothetical protein
MMCSCDVFLAAAAYATWRIAVPFDGRDITLLSNAARAKAVAAVAFFATIGWRLSGRLATYIAAIFPAFALPSLPYLWTAAFVCHTCQP